MADPASQPRPPAAPDPESPTAALTEPGGEPALPRDDEHWIGKRIGVWELTALIGSGGMGAVYLAERADEQFRQQVALKRLRSDQASIALLRSFNQEREILARLDHPNIARLLDGGLCPEAGPWLAMEFVRGQSLRDWCDQRALSIRDRIRLFLEVCAAVDHAHRSLIVHRDLKPANILVGEDGRVRLLDFGIARLLSTEGERRDRTLMRAFTPDYAAPEQILGEATTTAIDIYALGLILFELLTGSRAFARTTTRGTEPAQLTGEPTRPSRAALSSETDTTREDILRHHGAPPRVLARQLSGDLDAIVLKALRREPTARYGTVRELAEDLGRHLEGRPVLARRGGWRYRAGRFLRRHAWTSAAAGLALVSLIGGLTLALWQAQRAQLAQQRAEQEATDSRAVARFLVEVFQSADANQTDGREPTARELLSSGVAEIEARTDLPAGSRAALLEAMARAHLAIGEAETGMSLARAADEAALASGDARLTVETATTIGFAYNKVWRHEEALAAYQLAADRWHAGGPLPLELLSRIDWLRAVDLRNLQRTEESRQALEQAYQRRRQSLPLLSGELVETMVLRAYTLGALGDSAAALAMTTEFFEAMEQAGPLPLQRQRYIVGAHAYALQSAGHHEAAVTQFRRSVALNERLYGAESPRIAVAVNNLGQGLRRAGQLDEAITVLRRAAALRRAQGPAGELDLGFQLNNLGAALLEAGKAAEAEACWLESIELHERNDRRDRSVWSSAQLALIKLAEQQGRPDLARERLGMLVEGHSTHPGLKDHPEFIALQERLMPTQSPR